MEMELNNRERKPLRARKRQEEKKSSLVSEIFKDYCSSTSIHGIGYLGADNKTLAEKIWWVFVFALSVAGCSHLIYKTWKKWNDNPVIVTFAQEQSFVWEIPFPAVTICPVSKTSLEKYDFGKNYQNRTNLTGDEYKKMWDISLICNLRELLPELENDTMMFTDEDFIKNIESVEPEFDVIHTKWKNREYKFKDLFVKRLTEEGFCYTFNSFNQDDLFTDEVNKNVNFINHTMRNEGWKVDKGYPPDLNLDTYPHRTAEDGLTAGLSVFITSYSSDRDFACGIPVAGYKVILHNPAEVPQAGRQYILVPESRQMVAAVKPELIKTSQGLQDIATPLRKCYIEDEKHLRFFRVYTQNNCRMECLANVTKEYCDCVPFYTPRDSGTRVCAFGKQLCIEQVESITRRYEMMQRENKVPEEEKGKKIYQIFDACNCLPSCSSLQFTAETSQAKTYIVKALSAMGLEDIDNDLMSSLLNEESIVDELSKEIRATKIDVFFKETQFIAFYRSELYGLTDFLGNCGGLLGLFMGFSFLSLIEILYFLTIRIFCRLRTRTEENGD